MRRSLAFRPCLESFERRLVPTSNGMATLVANAASVDFTAGKAQAYSLASLSGPTDMPNTTYTETIDWGDGHVEHFTGTGALAQAVFPTGGVENGYGSVVGQHTYQTTTDAVYTIKINVDNVTDPECIVHVSATLQAHVHAADTVLTPVGTTFTAHGNTNGRDLATVSYPSLFGPAPASQFAAVVYNGDGTADQLNVVPNPDGTFAVVSHHAYAAPGNYYVQVLVLDFETWTYSEVGEWVVVS